MAHHARVRVLAALLSAAPLGASAADAPAASAAGPQHPLRTLTYAVDVTIVDVLDSPDGRLSGGTRAVVTVKGRAVGPRDTSPSGSGEKRSGKSAAAKGTITVDVVRATDDAGLVVDVAEETAQQARPRVRIAIAADGTLFYDPANADKLSEEEIAVAHWLGRGFYGDHPTDVGTAWVVDQSSSGRTDIERYRVLAREATQVTLDYALEERSSAARGYAGTREGSLVYDTAMVVPVKAAFESVARRQIGQSFNTLRTSVKLTLASDSFAGRRP
jgi:hypothetical protein